MLHKLKRTYYDAIYGFGQPMRYGRFKHKSIWTSKQSRWVHRFLKVPRSEYEPMFYRDQSFHCRLCAAVESPVHQRLKIAGRKKARELLEARGKAVDMLPFDKISKMANESGRRSKEGYEDDIFGAVDMRGKK